MHYCKCVILDATVQLNYVQKYLHYVLPLMMYHNSKLYIVMLSTLQRLVFTSFQQEGLKVVV